MSSSDRVILDHNTLFVYKVVGRVFAYVGRPSPVESLGTVQRGPIHDYECRFTGCDRCIMDAVTESGCGACGSLHHVTEEHDILEDTDNDWYGI